MKRFFISSRYLCRKFVEGYDTISQAGCGPLLSAGGFLISHVRVSEQAFGGVFPQACLRLCKGGGADRVHAGVRHHQRPVFFAQLRAPLRQDYPGCAAI